MPVQVWNGAAHNPPYYGLRERLRIRDSDRVSIRRTRSSGRMLA